MSATDESPPSSLWAGMVTSESRWTIIASRSGPTPITIPFGGFVSIREKLPMGIFVNMFSRAFKTPAVGRTIQFYMDLGYSAMWITLVLLIMSDINTSVFAGIVKSLATMNSRDLALWS